MPETSQPANTENPNKASDPSLKKEEEAQQSLQHPSQEEASQETRETQPQAKDNLADLRPIEQMLNNNQVLVIHGPNPHLKDEIIAFLKELGLDPVVTQSDINTKQPLAEKALRFRDVRFIIILLYTDQFVYPKDGKPAEALLKADQKVVFELGFWIGKRGRDKVFVLHYDQKSFRIPSEYFDAIFTPLDKKGLWKKELLERLKQNGFTFHQQI